jgi:hypothetical protein
VKLTASFNTVLLSFLLSGCAVRSVYIPICQNTPLFKDDKEVKVVGYAGTNHVELQMAHNPTKNLAVCGNVSFGAGISIYDFAVGTYGYNSSKNWRAEIFTGYGSNSNYAFQTANYNALLNQPIRNFEVRSLYDKYYIQPAVGYFGNIRMYKMNYSFSLSARVSVLYFKTYSFKEIDYEATQQTGQNVYIHNVNYRNGILNLLEPCFTNKVGIKNFNVILQGQFFIPYSEQIDISYTVFSPGFLFAAGLQYNLVFKKKHAPKD